MRELISFPMMKALIGLVFLTFFSAASWAQTHNSEWPSVFFSGYDHVTHGGVFNYHSPDPEINASLLVRSEDSSEYVEWETDKVPADFHGSQAYFVWMFGIAVTANGHSFHLSVNGKELLSFRNPTVSEKKSWSLDGAGGSELTFIPTMIDMYNDLMGYAVLRMPLNELRLGRSQILRINGETAASRTWYMTFESPVQEKMKITQLPSAVRENGGIYDLLRLEVTHLGSPTAGKLFLNGIAKETFDIIPGSNSFIMTIPEVHHDEIIDVKFEMKGATFQDSIHVNPVRDWIVYLVEHTHTDVGYTEPQNEIMPEQLRYIDYALDYCDETDEYPEDARFRWTCETAWAVQEYLSVRPKPQVERLLKRIREGRIEVTGLFLNMSDMYDESCLSNLMNVVKTFKNAGIDVTAAMQDDVNGVPWCLVDYLESAGVKYLDMGENVGHAREPFDIPTAFWWESPSGHKILAYRGEHYHFGNMLGILGNEDNFKASLLRYLRNLETKAYPFDKTMIQFSGYWIDDSPPSIAACDLVKKWNEKFEWPKLKLATVSGFFKTMNEEHGSQLPTYRLAWPDWWTDGAGSSALETAYVRGAQSDFIANQGLLSMAMLLGADIKPDELREMNSVNENIAFYDEHSFGADESITDPLSLNSTVQWNEKSAFAWTAVKENGLLRQESSGLLREFTPKLKFPSITVFNTMNVERSGIAEFFTYNSYLKSGKTMAVVDAAGNEVPIEFVKGGPGGNYCEIYAKDVPAFGYRTYRVIARDQRSSRFDTRDFTGILENQYYRIKIDSTKGGIESLIDKSTGLDLVDAKAPWELGQFIYETLPDRRLLDAPNSIPYSPGLFTRTGMTNVRIGRVVDGPIWMSVNITGQVTGCADSNGVTCEIRLYKTEKRVQFVYSMIKLQVFTPEAVYVAFPFESQGGHLTFEVQGGTVIPGKGQLPGSACDWNGVQNFASVCNKDAQIIFVSPEAPLMEFGDINTGKWQEVAQVEKPYIYSYVLNNYWGTNFKAAQEGGLSWTYDITSSGDRSTQYATGFGWGCRVPLAATFRPSEGDDTALTAKSVLHFNDGDLFLVFARPSWDGEGVVLCIRATDGKRTVMNISNLIGKNHSLKVYEVNSLEEPIGSVVKDVSFNPFEVKFLKLTRYQKK